MLSVRKILQALYFIQSKAPKNNIAKYDIIYLLKIMFFADRYHIRHFGFVASGDKYFAMKKGPVASAVKDILYVKIPYGLNSAEMSLLKDIEVLSETDVKIAEQNDDELSDSYKQSLYFAIKTYGKLHQLALSEISHDYPEWKKHERKILHGGCVEMSFTDFFENPKDLNNSKKYGIIEDPFKEEDTAFLEILKDEFREKNENASRNNSL